MRALAASGLVAICLACATPAAGAPLEQSFFGVQGWRNPTADELRSLAHAGVGSLRVGFNRATVLGPGGIRRWAELDELVAGAAESGIELLPVLVDAPHGDRGQRARPPSSADARREWADWVSEVVERYGWDGDFWLANPDLPFGPVTAWQVWNEPNLVEHWPRPSPGSYVALLRASSRAIRDADAHASVVLAGIPDTRRGIRLRPYLRALYRQRGFRRLFDVIALHPYARDVDGVERGIEIANRIMRRFGDGRRRTWITEIGWATSGPAGSRFVVDVDEQATRLSDVYDMFIEERERWRLERVFWFSLRDRDLTGDEPDWFGPHTGLFYRSGLAKPAWQTFAAVAGGVAGDWLDRPLG